LAGELYDEWLTPMRDRYRQHFAYALELLAVRFEQSGDYAADVRPAERLVAQDSLREAHHQLLSQLHIANQGFA